MYFFKPRRVVGGVVASWKLERLPKGDTAAAPACTKQPPYSSLSDETCKFDNTTAAIAANIYEYGERFRALPDPFFKILVQPDDIHK